MVRTMCTMAQPGRVGNMQAYNMQKIIVTQTHSPLNKEMMMVWAMVDKGVPAISAYCTPNNAFWVFKDRADATLFMNTIQGTQDPRISKYPMSAC